MADWKSVKREDVIEAIEIFNRKKPDFKVPRTTYLIYGDMVYPGKQIRRMAHVVSFGVEPTEKEIYGGKPTIKFFEKLEFDTYWTKRDAPIPKYEEQIEEMKLKKINNKL